MVTRVDLSLGLAPHTGWAVAVLVGGDATAPQVLHRERVELVPDGVERFAYHLVQDWPLEKAERSLADTDAAVDRTAKQVLADLAETAAGHGDLVAIGVVGHPHELPDDLATILAKHMLLHAGEGDLFLSALLDAADALGLPATLAPPKKTVEQVAALIGTAPGLLVDRLTALRKELGAPWTADHKAATAAALLALAQ
jgi:hypothetical protein